MTGSIPLGSNRTSTANWSSPDELLRTALPVTGCLNHEGRYAGVDVSRDAIAWPWSSIPPRHPHQTHLKECRG